jgi:hypothetical protein
VVTAVGKAWQQNEDTCPPSLWSLRLSTSAGRDVVVALGELDEKLEKLLYHPDALLVIFDEATARSYTTGMKSGNAWGSGGLP